MVVGEVALDQGLEPTDGVRQLRQWMWQGRSGWLEQAEAAAAALAAVSSTGSQQHRQSAGVGLPTSVSWLLEMSSRVSPTRLPKSSGRNSMRLDSAFRN